jgi:CelD/BcsL family acetyltransferase involved in cellulose biosynthesis
VELKGGEADVIRRYRARRVAGRSSVVSLEPLEYVAAEWERAASCYPQAEVFHSPQWLAFLAAAQGAEPVLAAVRADGAPVGHFVGAVVRRYGMRILGSPMPGWNTQHMGFLLERDVAPQLLADALRRLAFADLGCVHVELSQRDLTAGQLAGSGYTTEDGGTYLVDLSVAEEAVLARMAGRTRTYVRRAGRNGLTVEVATGLDFADDYHAQLTEVFARQGLAPTYGVERVRHLIRTVGRSDQLLLLRVRGPDGACVATGVSVGRNGIAVNWGTANAQAASALHPNELLWWETMRTWRERGATCYDMGGRGDYKAKYGGVFTDTVRFHRSRLPVLAHGRAVVERLARARQVVGARRGGGRSSAPSQAAPRRAG